MSASTSWSTHGGTVTHTCKGCGKQNRIPADHLQDKGRCGSCKAELSPVDQPLDVDGPLFDQIVRTAKVPVFVDFWAEWCAPCRMAAPEVARTASEMAGKAVVLKVDTDEHPQIAARFGVRGIPTFVVLRDGRTVFQQAGVVDHSTMTHWLSEA